MDNTRLSVVYVPTSDLLPYAKNPRKNDKAVDAVAASIREFGFKVPIIIDASNEIIAGHTRLKAAKKLGLKDVPCIRAEDLSEQQIKAFRLADNKTTELADWDDDLLAEELSAIQDVDMQQFGFEIEGEDDDDKYTATINIPQYEITGERPDIDDLVDHRKTDELIDEIEAADIPDDEKEFLRKAAKRHLVFNYRNIAEYYAHATPAMQRLMEKSALVIIDIDNAIANGYVRLSEDIKAMLEDDINA